MAAEEWIGVTRPLEDIWTLSSRKPSADNGRAILPSGALVFENTSSGTVRPFDADLELQAGVSLSASGKGDSGVLHGLYVSQDIGVSGARVEARGSGAQASGLVSTGEFWIAAGGQVEAHGEKGGTGISAEHLRLYSGTLTLLPDTGGNARSRAFVLSGARTDDTGRELGPDVLIGAGGTLYLPVTRKTDGSGWAVGRMVLSHDDAAVAKSDVVIEKGATLSLYTSGVLDLPTGSAQAAGTVIEIATANLDGTIQDNAGWVGRRTSGVLGYEVTLSEDRRSASVSVTRLAPLSDLLEGPVRNVALAVETSPNVSAENSALYDRLSNTFTADGTSAALRTLTPQAGALLPRVSMVVMDAGFNAVRRETLVRTRPPAVQQVASRESVSYISDLVRPKEDLSVWFTPLGGFDHLREASASYADSTFNWGGGSAGLSTRMGPLTLSVAGVAALGRLDLGSDGQSQTKSFGAVVSVVTDPLNTEGTLAPWLSASAGYLYTNADQDRRELGGTTASADVDSHTFRVAGEMGQDFEIATSWRLSPSIGVDYTSVSQGAYRETSGATPMDVRSTDLQSLRPRVGVEVAHQVTPGFELRASGTYLYEALDTAVDLEYGLSGLSGIRMTGQDRGRHFGQIGLGATYHAGDSFTLNGGYALMVGDRYDAHTLWLRVKYEF